MGKKAASDLIRMYTFPYSVCTLTRCKKEHEKPLSDIAQLKALRFPSNKDSYQQTPTQSKHLPPRALLWLLIKPFTPLPEPNIELGH